MLKRMLLASLLLMGWPCLSTWAQEKLPTEDDYYPITSLDPPAGIVLESGAIELLPDEKIAVASRRGDVYIVSGVYEKEYPDPKYSLFASGLHEVLGLAYRDGWLYVTQRCEVTRLKDLDGDGRADKFETVSDGWGISGDYHEYAFGSTFDREGNIWVTLCLTGSFTADSKYRGFCLRVTPDGKTIPTCSGLRSPGGVGMNDVGDMFYTDNQGPWNGTCGLKHLKPGGFMGHPTSFKFYELSDVLGPKPEEPKSGSRIHVERQRVPQLVPTAVMFPYKKMGQSASGIATDMSEGKFGPFTGQMFVGDQTFSTVMRVYLEQVNGVYQGVCFPFREGIGSGSLGMRLSPTGELFVGGTNRGWGSRGGKQYSLDRINWTGKVPFEIHQMRALPDGFELRFTEPVDKEACEKLESYNLQTYTYIYQSSYGSPEVDHTNPKIESATVSEDGLRVKLKIDGLQLGHVHELHAAGVRSKAGLPLLHADAYYTLNEIPNKPPVAAAGKPYVIEKLGYKPATAETKWTGKIYYRSIGAKEFLPADFAKNDTGDMQAVVPASVTSAPFEYYLEIQPEGQAPITLPAGGATEPVKVSVDSQPPGKVSGFKQSDVKDTAVKLSWQPAEDDQALVGYRLFRGEKEDFECTTANQVADLEVDSAAKGELVISDNAPLAGQKAWYAVRAVDAAGQLGEPVYLQVEVPENEAPKNELQLDAVSAGQKVVLRWRGPLEPDVVAIELLRGVGAEGELQPLATINDLKQNSYLDENVEAKSEYRYTLQLRDRGKLASATGPLQLVRAGLFLKRINCGGDEFIGADGIAWEADKEKLPGSNRWLIDHEILEAGDLAPLYQSERWSNDKVNYEIPVEPGKYRVLIHFAETNRNFQAAGKRQFDVIVDGEKKFAAVDVFAEVGGYKPYILSTDLFVIDEAIKIELRKVKLGPAIKAIEVRGLPEDEQPAAK